MNREVWVTDTLWRKSLSAIRALGRKGYEVHACGDSVFTSGFYSRFTYATHLLPDPSRNRRKFCKKILGAAKLRAHKPILLPMEDATLQAILLERSAFEESFDFLLPSNESLSIALDKSKTQALAQSINIITPRSFYPASAHELHALIKNLVRPVGATAHYVIKPTHSSGSQGILYTHDLSQNKMNELTFWEDHWQKYGTLMAQEMIPREGIARGVSLLYDMNSRCIAAFAHERIYEYPVKGGPSTQRKSIHAPELVRQSQALLDALKWRGVAMVEWKEHPQKKEHSLLEINPRFWGSLELAHRAGVPFSPLYVQACLGQPIPEVDPSKPSYPAEVRVRWLIPGDLLRYLTSPKERRESLYRFLRGILKESEDFAWDDIKGSIANIVCLALQALRPRNWKYFIGR